MKSLPLLLTVLASFFLASCGDDKKGDAFASEFISEMEKYPSIINSVEDSASADQAVKDIDALATRIEKLANDNKNVKVSKSKDKEIQSRVESAMEKVGTEVEQALENIGAKPNVTAEDIQKIGQASMDFGTRLMNIEQ